MDGRCGEREEKGKRGEERKVRNRRERGRLEGGGGRR